MSPSHLQPKTSRLGQNIQRLNLRAMDLGSHLGLDLKGLVRSPVAWSGPRFLAK